jgi:hypothetical protein
MSVAFAIYPSDWSHRPAIEDHDFTGGRKMRDLSVEYITDFIRDHWARAKPRHGSRE